MRPTQGRVRTGLACAIDRSPASSGKPWSAGISGWRPTQAGHLRGQSRCGHRNTRGNRCCRFGCRGRCGCASPRDSSSGCCSTTRRAARGTRFRQPRKPKPAPAVCARSMRPPMRQSKKIFRRCAANSVQRAGV